MFDPSAKDEPWWPLEWHESHATGYPTCHPVFHPTVQAIEHSVAKNEWYLRSRSMHWKPKLVYQGTGDQVEDDITLRCILLEAAYPEGSEP